MRKKGRRRRLNQALFVAGGLVSLAAGAAVCLLLQNSPRKDAPAIPSVPVPWRQEAAVPLPPDRPAKAVLRTDGGVRPPAGRSGSRADVPPMTAPAQTSSSPRAEAEGTPRDASARKMRKAGADLSAYRVRARSSSGDTLLPGDSSLSAGALTESLQPQKKASRNDGGK